MKFGRVDKPEKIDFTLAQDHNATVKSLNKGSGLCKTYVGCAKWNKTDLKSFYPKGVKDELSYYSSQFNSIELNATFYRIFPKETVQNWFDKTPDDFMFFPKIPQLISQFRRLKNCEDVISDYIESIGTLKHKLGMIFLQMPQNFAPKNAEDLFGFLKTWPSQYPLALELRHADWYSDGNVFNELCSVMEENNITHVLTDTAGRRDLMHMRLTTPKTFIRFTGANHSSDYTRLDDWIARLNSWKQQGMDELNFFVHQNLEKASPLLSSYFMDGLNKELNLELTLPDQVGKRFLKN